MSAGAARAAGVLAPYTALRVAHPEGKAISVTNLALDRDALHFQFASGVFQFLSSVDGRAVGAVFVGKGRFELTPASELERRHLAFVTGEKALATLSDSFEGLVLLFSDGTAAEIESHGSAGSSGAGAEILYKRFQKQQRTGLKRNFQIHLLADLLEGRDGSRGAFVAYFEGQKYPPALAAFDPRGLDWLLGSVGGEGTALWSIDDDKGGLWYCSASKAEVDGGKAVIPRMLTDARRYAIDTTIRSSDELAGTTTIEFVPLEDGLRVLPIHLLPTLRLKEVSFSHGGSGDWSPVEFIQENEKEDAGAAVVFAVPLPRAPIQLRIAYEGKGVLEEAPDKTYYVRARDSWYPNLGTFTELASYSLTYRYPKNLQVVSVGSLVEEKVEGNQKVAVWKQDRPIRVAGFNYGKFLKFERPDHDTGVTLDVYASETRGNSEALEDAAVADGFNTVRVGTLYFGALPDTHVSITQQGQYSFGQSWPTLIYLPSSVAGDRPNRISVLTRDSADFVDRVGSHEFAHQWWGHLVGWNGYRDQWLSEGFAEFASALVVEHAGGAKASNELWERTRQRILEKPRRAFVANDEAGPIAEGWRIATWRNGSAYQAMTYRKGAYVLQMLRMMMRDLKSPRPDENFISMLKDFASSYAGKNPSTSDFQSVVERHMTPTMDLAGNQKMSWFFQQWVYGTEIPTYRQKLDIARTPDGQYRLTGSISQEGVSADFRAVVHVYVDFGHGEWAHLGSLPFVGTSSKPLDATLRLSREPKRLVLNANHDVLYRD